MIDGLKYWRKMKYFELRVFCAEVQESKALTLIKGSDVFPCCSGLHRSHLTPAPIIEQSSQTWHRTIRMLWKLCNHQSTEMLKDFSTNGTESDDCIVFLCRIQPHKAFCIIFDRQITKASKLST